MTVGSYMEPTPQWLREQPKLSLLPASHCPFPGHTSVCGILVSGTSPDNPRKVGEFLLEKKITLTSQNHSVLNRNPGTGVWETRL